MTSILRLYDALVARIDEASPWLIPTLARIIFAGVFLMYFWKSAMTKIGSGLFSPSVGAYAQIFPKAIEAAGYNTEKLSSLHTLVVLFGTWAEFVLPALVVLGLFTRLAAIGMIGFISVQSLVDITGHGLGKADIGTWFDNQPASIILDQRALWIFLLIVLVVKGGGPLSLDRFFARFRKQ